MLSSDNWTCHTRYVCNVRLQQPVPPFAQLEFDLYENSILAIIIIMFLAPPFLTFPPTGEFSHHDSPKRGAVGSLGLPRGPTGIDENFLPIQAFGARVVACRKDSQDQEIGTFHYKRV